MKVQSLISVAALLGLFVSTSATAFAANGVPVPSRIANSTSSSTSIRSANDLRQYLRIAARSGSPLNALSPGARLRFLGSLTFGRRGVTSFAYDDLQAELTPTEIYRILSLFGMQQYTVGMKEARIVTALDKAIMAGRFNGSKTDFVLYNYYCDFAHHQCVGRLNNACSEGCYR